MKRLCLFLLILTNCSNFLSAQLPIAAAPSWITRRELPPGNTALDDAADDGYVDVNYERQVSLAQKTVFVRFTKRVLTAAGVENASEVSINYDPSFQRVQLHSLRILRGGSIIDKTKTARFQLIQEETERSMHIYNGRLSAVHALEDIRVGDVIDYSYSIVGFNPVYGGRFSTTFDTRFSVPVYSIYFKVLVPPNRSLQVRNSNEPTQALTSVQAGENCYEWNLRNCKPFEVEEHIPSWYDPYPFIQLSEFKSWNEVVDWARGLYSEQAPAASVRSLAQTFKTKYADDESRALAAIRFVQDEVRYLGIEMGANSHLPHAPAQVLAQRFGDCKDKSYLLCHLLRALGFEAWPVLTSTDLKRTVKSWLPTALAFDHCTVYARIGGQSLWIDPTITDQRGTLASLSYPDYQVGLVVRAGTNGFTDIPLQDKGRVAVKEIFVVPSMLGPAQLHVQTVYTGSFADELRADLRRNNRNTKLKEYQKYYSYYFPKIVADSLRYVDDEAGNRFTMIEDYTVPDVWTGNDAGRRLSVSPFIVDAYLRKPDARTRRMPFALNFPVRITEDIEVQLPEEWRGEPVDAQYHAPGFNLLAKVNVRGDRSFYHYEYEATADAVLPADIDRYRSVAAEVDENISYELTYGDTGSSRSKKSDSKPVNYAPLSARDLYPLLYVLLGVAVFVTWILRRNRARIR